MRDKGNSIPLHIFKHLYQKAHTHTHTQKAKKKHKTKKQTPLKPFNAKISMERKFPVLQ